MNVIKKAVFFSTVAFAGIGAIAAVRTDTRDFAIATGVERIGSANGSGLTEWATTAIEDGWTTLVSGGQSVNVLVLNGPSVVGGRLSQSETWGASRVVVVRDDVVVPSGMTLTLDAGCVVKFTEGARIAVENGGAVVSKGAFLTDLSDDSVGGDTNFDGESVASGERWWLEDGAVAALSTVRFINGAETLPTRTYTAGRAYGSLPVPTNANAKFGGWWTGRDGSGVKVTDQSVVASGSTTLYAYWIAWSLAIEPQTANVAAVANSGVFSVTANDAWNVSCDASWISIAVNGSQISYSVGENANTAARTATIRVQSANGMKRDFTVNQSGMAQLGTVTIEPPDGTTFIGMSRRVAISGAESGAEIRYTIDGSEPTVTSKLYAKSFNIFDTTVVKAKAFMSGKLASETVSSRIVRLQTLAEALDVPLWTVTTSGDAQWFVDEADGRSGGSCARSGEIGPLQSSTMESTINGPGTLTFWWGVDCEDDEDYDNWDYLVFSVDGVEVARIDGYTGWTQVSAKVRGEGNHTLTWTYVKDDWDDEGLEIQDCGWVDSVSWTAFAGDSEVPVAWLESLGVVSAEMSAADAADLDVDGDGLTMAEEYIAGTDPNDPDSVFRVMLAVVGGKPVVTGVPNLLGERKYTIYGKKQASDADWQVVKDGKEGEFNIFRASVSMPEGGDEVFSVNEVGWNYSVTLDANGGTVSGQSSVSAEVRIGKYTNQAAANRAVARTGYTLVGWYDAKSGGNMVFDARGFAVNGKYWDGAYSPSVSSALWKHVGNVTAYARWVESPPYRVVTFDANGGVIGNLSYACAVVEQGKYTSQAGASVMNATRSGHTLIGWYDAKSGGNMVFDAQGYAVNGTYWNGTYSPKVSSATWKYAGNVTAYAQWVQNNSTVTLDANGGTVSGQTTVSFSVEYGKYTNQAGANRSVSRSGYTLRGWYDAKSGGNMVFDARGYAVNGVYWNGAYSPSVSSATWKGVGNVTVYAQWVATPPYSVVTFDANGGAISNVSQSCSVTEQGKYTSQAGAAAMNAARAGYTLVGWYDAKSGGNMLFDAHGYAVNGVYWNGTYSPKVSSATWKGSGNVVAYARWAQNKSTVTLDANGGTVSGAATVSFTVEYGKYTSQAGANRTVSRSGYTLVGWYDAKSGGSMVFDARGYAVNGKYWNGAYSPSVSSAAWKGAGNLTAYARWVATPSHRVVTFDANGGAISNATASCVVVEQGKYTSQAGASGMNVSRTGYTLVGWYDTNAASGGEMVFDARGFAVNGKYWNGAYSPSVSSATWKYAGNVTAYARWVATPPYSVVTFDANGGAISNASYNCVVVEHGKYTNQAGASGTKATRLGYTLVGWYDAKTGGNMVFNAQGYAVNGTYWNGSYSPKVSSALWKYAGSVTAYARWTANKYTVTLDANGGTVSGSATVSFQVEYGKYTSQAGANRTVSRSGYTLRGWYDAKSGGNMVFDARGYAVNGKYWNGAYSPSVSSATWKGTGNVTVYAQWVATPPYRVVTFDANGGVLGNATCNCVVEQGKYTSQAGASAMNATRTGYTLVGWYDAKTGGNMVFNAQGYAVNGTYWNGSYVPSKSSATWKYAGSVTAYARWVSASGNIRMAAPSGDMEDGFGYGDMFEVEAPPFFQGEYEGVFADDGGRFMLTLDEGLETAYFVTWTEDGGVACECEAAVVGDVLILTTETGAVYHLVWDEDGLVATRIE